MNHPQLEPAMRAALAEAALATVHGDVPVGAVLLDPEGKVVASDHNRREELQDPTAHAEILVLSAAARARRDWRLTGHTLVVTLEPCAMCAGAVVLSRLERIAFGTPDLKAGGAGSLYNIPQDRRLNHQVEVEVGILKDECAAQLSEFFSQRRN
jgi:tRNA(adenine34) deaminase